MTFTPGTATAADVGAVPATVTFGANETSKEVVVPVVDDGAEEPDETFGISIAPGPDTPVGRPTVATVTIAGSDPTTTTETVREVPGPERVREVRIGPDPIVLLPGRCANARAGTSGDDALAGTTAGDRLSGGRGADGISGGRGRDCLRGGPGDDLLSGGSGADDVRGQGGDDVVLGGSGADRLSGGGGRNRISGGGGADRISVANGRRDVVAYGPGRDRVGADRRDRLRGCERVTRRR